MRKLIGLIIILVIAFILIITVAAQAVTTQDIENEIKIGKCVSDQFAIEVDFIDTPMYIQKIFDKLIIGLNRPLPYNLKVIKDCNPNAFCIPGGTIYITTGMIKFTENYDQIAAVLSHELVHADKAHLIIQIERGQNITLAALITELSGSKSGVAKMLSRVAKATSDSSTSYEMEREADILKRSGFSVYAPVMLMENIEKRFKRASRQSGTHPSIRTRISSLKLAIANL